MIQPKPISASASSTKMTAMLPKQVADMGRIMHPPFAPGGTMKLSDIQPGQELTWWHRPPDFTYPLPLRATVVKVSAKRVQVAVTQLSGRPETRWVTPEKLLPPGEEWREPEETAPLELEL
jgi:hypothetical protein